MQVRHGLPSVGAIVDDHPESFGAEAFLFRDDPYPGEEVAEEILVGGFGFPDPHDQLPGYEEKVYRSLGGDVAEAEAEVVLVDDVARDFTVGDLLEDGFLSHGSSEGERNGEGEAKSRPEASTVEKAGPSLTCLVPVLLLPLIRDQW